MKNNEKRRSRMESELVKKFQKQLGVMSSLI